MHIGACILWEGTAGGKGFLGAKGPMASGFALLVGCGLLGGRPNSQFAGDDTQPMDAYSPLANRRSPFAPTCSAITSRSRSMASTILIDVNE